MKHTLAFILTFFCTSVVCTAQDHAVFNPVGEYAWVKRNVISNPEKLSCKSYVRRAISKFTPKQKQAIYKRRVSFYKEDTDRKFSLPQEQFVTFRAKAISPVQKLAASPFLFKDNSTYNISYTDEAHGFISNAVVAIAEDNEKNIWVATDVGLIKYDGSYYYLYNIEAGLISNSINNVEFDEATGLWISTPEGFQILRNDSVFEPVLPTIKNSRLDVVRVNIDGRHNIWVNTLNHGAFKFIRSLKTVQHFDTSCGLPSNAIQNVVIDKSGNYWFAGKGLVKIEGKEITHWYSSKSYFNEDQWSVFLEDADTMWVGTFDNCIFKISPNDTSQLSIYPNFAGRVYDLTKSKGVLWFTLYGGGLVYLKNDDYIAFDETNGLSGNQGYALHKDTYGNIWVSTTDAGISRLNGSGLVTDCNAPKFLRNAVTIQKDKDGNRWYFLNGGGLWKETATGYQYITNETQKPLPSVRHFMDGLLNSDGTAWLASYSYGIAFYDKKNITFYYYSDDPVKRVVLHTAVDGNNTPWFATMNYGLIYLKGKDFYHLTSTSGLASDRINWMARCADGSILCLSSEGIQKISNDTIYDLYVSNKLFKFAASSFYSTLDDDYLIGTDKGLLRMKNNTLYVLDSITLFDGHSVSSILRDSIGTLWFNNSQGIARAKLKDFALSNIQRVKADNKLILTQINGAGYIDENNIPHWSSSNGFFTYKHELESTETPVPRFKFLSATINGAEVGVKTIPAMLPDDKLNIHYSVICWGNEDGLRSKYALINTDKQDTIEIAAGGRRMIEINNVNAGDYQLVLIATLGNKKHYSYPLHIKIKPHWYKSNWFFALCMLLISMSVYWLFRFRTQRLQKSKEELEGIVASRTADLSASLAEREVLLKEIHHRVKNNLQVISGLLELQKEEMTDEKVRAAFSEGQSRVRSVALIHHNLYQHENLSGIFFKSFVGDLVKYLAEVFDEKNKKLEVELLGEDVNLDIDTAVPLGLIINELLTNAYKYAVPQKGTAFLKLELRKTAEGEYELTYRDNGPGIKGEINFERASSLGLRLIKGLIKQLAGSVRYHYDAGAVFTFTFKDAEARRKE